MITKEQEEKIQFYLLSTGLAFNIMLEVKDHMISQISELMCEDYSFEQSFEVVKKQWEPELKLVNVYLFNSGRMPKIQKKLFTKESNLFGWKALGFSLVVLALFIVVAKTTNKENFTLFYQAYYVLASVILPYIMISNYKIFLIKRKFNHFKIATSQYLMVNIFTGAIYILLELISLDYRPEKFYNNINNISQLEFAPLLWIIFANGFFIYGVLAFLKYKKDVRSVMNYLKSNVK